MNCQACGRPIPSGRAALAPLVEGQPPTCSPECSELLRKFQAETEISIGPHKLEGWANEEGMDLEPRPVRYCLKIRKDAPQFAELEALAEGGGIHSLDLEKADGEHFLSGKCQVVKVGETDEFVEFDLVMI